MVEPARELKIDPTTITDIVINENSQTEIQVYGELCFNVLETPLTVYGKMLNSIKE